jgi:hypothetical protein
LKVPADLHSFAGFLNGARGRPSVSEADRCLDQNSAVTEQGTIGMFALEANGSTKAHHFEAISN